MENLGLLAALGAALCWGTYMVPLKKAHSTNLLQFQVLMATAIVVSGFLASLLLGYSLNLNLYGLTSGILWGSANAISLVAVAHLGLSRAIPIMTSLVVVFSFLWGALFFHEISAGLKLGFVGMGLIVLGIILVNANANKVSGNIKKGLLAAVPAGVIFGSQLVPLKLGNLTTREFFFPVCVGIFLSALVIAIARGTKFKKEAMGLSLLSGVIWNIGNWLSITAISLIGLSKALPVSMSSTLVAVLWGLVYFKEVSKRRYQIQVLLGAVILVVGVIVLNRA